ncbi:MAG: EI24 domain-containing protein, partial [Planctomycetes bacterium]|nr:EI24 domain-containing protein [Planctomycetota bacterium]
MPDLPPFRLAQFVRGMSRPFQGAAFLLSRRGLKRYAALPLVLNLVLYLVALSVFFYFIANWQVGGVEWNFWGPVGSWLAAAVNWMSWTVKLVAVVAALAFSFFTFTAVGMVVASPLNDLLSEKVENAYAAPDEKVDLPLRFTSKAAVLSVYDSVGTLIRQLVCTILALPFLLVPMVVFVPLELVCSYFDGYGFLDAA